ncbi:PLP-dependent aminotransferase family protein [Pyxidicoccus fallax]|uniref:PLP-dependent aminotransferase family protein n=1 Tax=Pyxidicoccus fallax TaxID=394095 RepID=A0A848LQU1_9BACT|nr:PLP-dependent aminotransferase family protein [Pyxidicoccus fallax]NPC81023.1 PLP-dependent aminotransferase family protein [Pyxidicoccus fallax]
MSKRATTYIPPLERPLGARTHQRDLYTLLRAAILDRRLRPGSRIPSTRDLAREYGVARGTVVAVYGQLVSEGYLTATVGAGTRVSETVPDELLSRGLPAQPRSATTSREPPPPALARRGQQYTDSPFPLRPAAAVSQAFVAHRPALDAFPVKLWSRVAASRLRRLSGAALADGDPLGDARLRRVIAAYLGSARGVRCEADQVFIVSGVQQALELVARLVVDPGDAVWVEDPGYPGSSRILQASGAVTCPVPVDAEGLRVSVGEDRAPRARLACVTPAHQAPLGVAMSLARRLALLDWARRSRAWVFEDDYDSEYRYASKPLPALQGLDTHGCVLHAGSFSKTLFPALRLGYLVVPSSIVDRVAKARSLMDRYPGILPQAVLADFIEDGHYARHLRRMRELYAERRDALSRSVAARLSGALVLPEGGAGLDTVGWLEKGLQARTVVAAAGEHRVLLEPLDRYLLRERLPQGVLLGFASLSTRQIALGVERLARALMA